MLVPQALGPPAPPWPYQHQEGPIASSRPGWDVCAHCMGSGCSTASTAGAPPTAAGDAHMGSAAAGTGAEAGVLAPPPLQPPQQPPAGGGAGGSAHSVPASASVAGLALNDDEWEELLAFLEGGEVQARGGW
jgi:hypothetical protein